MSTHTIAATLDPADPGVRAAAGRLAERLDDDTVVGQVIRSLLNDVARGAKIVALRSIDEVTPAQAAAMLGVSRQFVDRLCEDHVLPFRRLPGSRHRRLRVQDVLDLAAERDQRRVGADALRAAIAATDLDT
ncbi:MAG: helix-turn-helix domain-containing protein, partial [Propionibacteriaceae bacterium]|nr:helix-turn-helix domain-containing protein [Propionibacteriaceae bacterium]